MLDPITKLGKSLDDRMASLLDRPGKSTVDVVVTSTFLFYMAERGKNPKVNSIWDAYVYCTTVLSVGYADIFAQTPVGKIIGGTLMMIGPNLANSALTGAREPPDTTNAEILETLKGIKALLEAQAQAQRSS